MQKYYRFLMKVFFFYMAVIMTILAALPPLYLIFWLLNAWTNSYE